MIEPPGSDTWVVDKNAAYIEALAQLRHSMQDIAQGGRSPDPAVHQAAAANYDKAMEAVRQIARGFKAVGVGGLDGTVERLLEEPIRYTNPFIIRDPMRRIVAKINGDVATFCISQKNVLSKYPFQPTSLNDASLEEFDGIFHPATGAIWKFQQQSLADLTVKEGSLWKPKDPAKKPSVTPEMLAFLNRAQAVADVFYPSGATRPQLTYTLRPQLDPRLKDSTLELEIDGQPYQLTVLRKAFSWPPPPGTKDAGAVARLRNATSGRRIRLCFARWNMGHFSDLGRCRTTRIEQQSSGSGRTRVGASGVQEPITPAPVQLEIVGFPGDQDVFNPKFWQGLRCPRLAVQSDSEKSYSSVLWCAVLVKRLGRGSSLLVCT